MSDSKNGEFTTEELKAVQEAAAFFEDPGVFAKALNWVGQPLEVVQAKLPKKVQTGIARASKVALTHALQYAIKTLPDATDIKRSTWIHTGIMAAAGGAGGFLGVASLPVELPFTTLTLLRSIAEIARHYGNDLSSVEVQLECMYVFSMGSKSPNDDAIESAYYTSRIAFAEMIGNVSAFLAGASAREVLAAIESGSAPALVRFIADIAAQFEVRVTKKILAQSAPIMGAIGGASINVLFARFFQDCARHHFAVKAIERTRGLERTQKLFEESRQRYRESR